MTIHKHTNQVYLNRLGQVVGTNYGVLTYAGNQPDGRSWTREEGVITADGTPIQEQVTHLRFTPVRVSPDGHVFVRDFIIDAGGVISQICPEKVLADPTGTSVFQQFGDSAIVPISGLGIGKSDAFFETTTGGVRTRSDFTEDSETIFMRATDGLDIQLKALAGAVPEPVTWDDVFAAFVGNLTVMSTNQKLSSRTYARIPDADGIPLSLGNRVLVDQQLQPYQNGIYEVTRLGDEGSTWELTRTQDANTVELFVLNSVVLIAHGDIRANQTMRLVSEVTNIGNSNIIFEYVG